MKNRILLILVCFIFSVSFLFSQQNFQGINGINMDNYPRMDGSTSTDPLNRVIAEYLLNTDFNSFIIGEICGDTAKVTVSVKFRTKSGALLENSYIVSKYRDYYTGKTTGYLVSLKRWSSYEYCESRRDYSLIEQEFIIRDDNLPPILSILEENCFWENDLDRMKYCEESQIVEMKVDTLLDIGCYYLREKYDPNDFFGVRVKSSQTHQSFNNLIDNQTDVILVARKMSEDEKEYADSKGVTLIETPVALDAFVFLKNGNNPIESLTIEQVTAIYTGQITNWNEVGGNNTVITPYIRNKNSGSQELMESLVMQGKTMPDWKEDLVIGMMDIVYRKISEDATGICYTVYYYDEFIMQPRPWIQGETDVKRIAINGIYPDYNTIKNKSYPFIAPVYAVIRSDLDRNSMAYLVYEWLQTHEGKSVIGKSGYIPYETGENSMKQINNQYIQISPNPTEGIIEIGGIEDYTNLSYAVYNSAGLRVQSGKLKNTLDLSNRKGFHILTIMQNKQVIAREKIIIR